MKKTLLIVLVMLLLVSMVFAGCKKTEDTKAPEDAGMVKMAPELPIVDEPLTVDIAIVAPTKVIDMNTNEVTDYIEDLTGVRINWDTLPEGEIGMIWFDTPEDCPVEYSKKIVDKVHSIQPNCLISGRIGNLMGDFVEMGDNNYPTKPLSFVWEVPGTINDTWSYKSLDSNWKSAKQITTNLVRSAGFGGNYLLNVGPDEMGVIPPRSADVLREVGDWLKVNGESIYETEAGPELLFCHDWGYITQKDNKLFFHILKRSKKIRIRGIWNELSNARLLSTGEEIKFARGYPEAQRMPNLLIFIPDSIPDDFDIVIVMDFKGDKIEMANIETLY